MGLNEIVFLAVAGWVVYALWQWRGRRKPPIAFLASRSAVAEHERVNAFIADPSAVYALVDFIINAPAFESGVNPYVYWSEGGRIRVEKDIYGYEVQILPCEKFLDCNPQAYGLSRAQAKRLYEAILTRVPGTTTFRGK